MNKLLSSDMHFLVIIQVISIKSLDLIDSKSTYSSRIFRLGIYWDLLLITLILAFIVNHLKIWNFSGLKKIGISLQVNINICPDIKPSLMKRITLCLSIVDTSSEVWSLTILSKFSTIIAASMWLSLVPIKLCWTYILSKRLMMTKYTRPSMTSAE